MLPEFKVAERSVTTIVTLDEVRAHLNLFGDTSYDAELILMLDAAQQNVEDYLGEFLGATTVVQPLETFDGYYAFNSARPLLNRRFYEGVPLTHHKITAINSITYKANDGTDKTVAPATYIFDDTGEQKYVKLRNGNDWPSDLDTVNYQYPVQISYNAEWVTPPLPISQAIYMTVAEMFDNRADRQPSSFREVPISIRYLLKRHVRL